MKLIFMGPQGSGKGTQAKIISKELGICHISTGDLLRDAKGDLKEKVDVFVNKGNLVPDKLMLEVLNERMEKLDCKKGFILDGFPRNLKQADMLDTIIDIDKVVLINISDKKAIERLGGRLNCKKCGAVFNINTSIPKQEGKCDYCGDELYIRDDDKPEAIKKRLEIYHNNTEPILEKYKDKLIEVDGAQEIEIVRQGILEGL